MTASAKRARARLRATPKAPQHDRGADGPAMLSRASTLIQGVQNA